MDNNTLGVLVVDFDLGMLHGYDDAIRRSMNDRDFGIIFASGVAHAKSIIDHWYSKKSTFVDDLRHISYDCLPTTLDLIITDFFLPDGTGNDVAAFARRMLPDAVIIGNTDGSTDRDGDELFDLDLITTTAKRKKVLPCCIVHCIYNMIYTYTKRDIAKRVAKSKLQKMYDDGTYDEMLRRMARYNK